MYKFLEELDDTRVQSDYSVLASEFINFLSVMMTGRLFRTFDKVGLLDERTCGETVEILRSAKKQRGENGGWNTIRVIEKNAKVLEKLGLAENPIVVKNPVSRPEKSKS